MAEKLVFVDNNLLWDNIKSGRLTWDDLLNDVKPFIKKFAEESINAVKTCQSLNIKKVIAPTMGAVSMMTAMNLVKKKMGIKDQELKFYPILSSGYLEKKSVLNQFREVLETLIVEHYEEAANQKEVVIGFIDERISGATLKKQTQYFKDALGKIIRKLPLKMIPEAVIIFILEFHDVHKIIIRDLSKSRELTKEEVITNFLKLGSEEFAEKVNERIKELDEQREKSINKFSGVKSDKVRDKIKRMDKRFFKIKINNKPVELYLVQSLTMPLYSLFTEDIPYFTGLKYFFDYKFKIDDKIYGVDWEAKEQFIKVGGKDYKYITYEGKKLPIIPKGDTAYVEVNGKKVFVYNIERLPVILSLTHEERGLTKKYKELLIKEINDLL